MGVVTPEKGPLEDREPAQRVLVFSPLRCQTKGVRGESSEGGESEKSIKLTPKRTKTGNKTIHKQ